MSCARPLLPQPGVTARDETCGGTRARSWPMCGRGDVQRHLGHSRPPWRRTVLSPASGYPGKAQGSLVLRGCCPSPGHCERATLRHGRAGSGSRASRRAQPGVRGRTGIQDDRPGNRLVDDGGGGSGQGLPPSWFIAMVMGNGRRARARAHSTAMSTSGRRPYSPWPERSAPPGRSSLSQTPSRSAASRRSPATVPPSALYPAHVAASRTFPAGGPGLALPRGLRRGGGRIRELVADRFGVSRAVRIGR